ncbi:adenylyl-sulfate kinase 3 isoform X1 [Ziziphus jujuba]|uniref:Adenylyl-sulfate kinase n=1 Tax=Ziziphus jujuba TaxID=326968 RepID=A0A6P3YR41_ZIZJJ|nr:adenylyl-sulfate kinase 3 isoform X1 [Ziziphus jujuba]
MRLFSDMIASGGNTVTTTLSPGICLVYGPSASLSDRGFVSFSGGNFVNLRSRLLSRIKAMEGSRALSMNGTDTNGHAGNSSENQDLLSGIGNSTNIVWHECSVGKVERQKLLKQKGCVIWITGLSASGKSSVACALSQSLYRRGKLSYVLDGDNVRHGLNRDLSFKMEDRAENIRRVGEVAKLFADAGVICIASLISPYRRDRDACRALLPDGDFIEVFMDVPIQVCEARDPKGLYKLARAGKIKGFTGIDDPYEPPLNCEIVLTHNGGINASPSELAEEVISYLEEKGYLRA